MCVTPLTFLPPSFITSLCTVFYPSPSYSPSLSPFHPPSLPLSLSLSLPLSIKHSYLPFFSSFFLIPSFPPTSLPYSLLHVSSSLPSFLTPSLPHPSHHPTLLLSCPPSLLPCFSSPCCIHPCLPSPFFIPSLPPSCGVTGLFLCSLLLPLVILVLLPTQPMPYSVLCTLIDCMEIVCIHFLSSFPLHVVSGVHKPVKKNSVTFISVGENGVVKRLQPCT